MKTVWPPLAALACGLLFGLGLSISGMLDPMRVRGFLDIFGHWDQSLMFVLAGAVITAFIGFRCTRALKSPLLAERYEWPEAESIDGQLVLGSLMFGVGWGLSGLCPGPAIADLVLGIPAFVSFMVAMLGGMLLHRMYVAVNLRAHALKSAENEL